MDKHDELITSIGLHAIDAAQIPIIPRDYVPLDGSQKSRLLKLVEVQRAEVILALDEISLKGPKLKADLGRFAPDATQAHDHKRKLNVTNEAASKAAALVNYTSDVEASVNHDVMTYLLAVRKELLHVVEHDPQLAAEYPKVMALIEQRRDAILEGRARAKVGGNDPSTGPINVK